MTLPVADIDRWSADAVRTVFHAARARGQATLEAARQLSSLAVFDAWDGATAEVRLNTIGGICQDLNAHGYESLAVARAVGKAADDIEHVQSALRTLRRDAADVHMTIDPLTNTVTPRSSLRGRPMEAVEKHLQSELDGILREADTVDADLATAIIATDAEIPVSLWPQVQPLPDDPKQFNELWKRLRPDEKDRLYHRDHNIGNHAGMPWDPDDHLGKDHYNRMHLGELAQQSETAVDRLQHSLDELTGGYNTDDGALYAVQSQLAAARRKHAEYQAIQAELGSADGIRRYLGFLDDDGHAAVAMGNPDYATRNAIFVPGTGEDVTRLRYSAARAAAMYSASRAADKNLDPDDVSITTWMGYDRPMDVSQAASSDRARAGAGRLDTFESGLRASHVGPPSIDTVIGHSYGSTLVGAAASGGHHLDADNVIAVGSPGMLVDRAGGLNLEPGARVYAMRAANDIIGVSGVVTEWTLGPDPTAANFGAGHLAADPGPAGVLGLLGIDAHSSYWDRENIALANMGAVIAGVTPRRSLS